MEALFDTKAEAAEHEKTCEAAKEKKPNKGRGKKPPPIVKMNQRSKGGAEYYRARPSVGQIEFDLPPEGSTMYTKRGALHQIKKTVKYSQERRVMMQWMIDNGLVPVKSKCLVRGVSEHIRDIV